MKSKTLPFAKDYTVRDNGTIARKGKSVPVFITRHGAAMVSIRVDAGYPTTRRVARLVGEAFCPSFKTSLRPVHRDGNRLNCKPANLKWVHVNEVCVAPRGDSRRTAKLTEQKVLEILTSGEPPAVLSKRYGVTPSHISAILARKKWVHIILQKEKHGKHNTD